MLAPKDRDTIVNSLLEAERSGVQTTRPSALFPDIDFEGAYAISSETARRKMAAGEKLIGYKVGLTSLAMQRASKIDEPDYGYLFESMQVPDGGSVVHSRYCAPRVELELAFVLGKTLAGPGVSLIDVMQATEYVIPSIEIIDTRVDEPRKIFDTISDNGAAAGIVMGGRPIRPFDTDIRMVPGMLYKDAALEETGLACGVMNHPANGIAWLANKLSALDVELNAGDIMLAGSFVRPVWAEAGSTVRADFGPFGSVAVHFE